MPTPLDGDPAVTALSTALARVTSLIPYLTARVNPTGILSSVAPGAPVPADGELVSGQALIDDPPWLGRIIRSSGSALGTDDPVLAASAFVQGYSYRVLALTIACLTAADLVPDASAPHMAIGRSGPWPSLVAFSSPSLLVLDGPPVATVPTDSDSITDALRFVLDTAITRHLGPLVSSVHTGIDVPLGPRLLWGNLAASAATAFRTMAGCLGSFVEPLGERFFALAPPEVQGLGSFTVIDHAGRRGWFFERTTCCLFDRLPDGVRCSDCSLTPRHLRHQAYRSSLDAS